MALSVCTPKRLSLFHSLTHRSFSFKLHSLAISFRPLSSTTLGHSIYPANDDSGIAETVCVLISASALGRWVDNAHAPVRPLIVTIVANRISLVLCCCLWLVLFSSSVDALKKVIFAMILLLGMVEKASRMSNILAMERTWIPILANPEDEQYSLTHLNISMRRIDITCKFMAPLVIAGVLTVTDPSVAALCIGFAGTISFGVELLAVLRVEGQNNKLRTSRKPASRPAIVKQSLNASETLLRMMLASSKKAFDFLMELIKAHSEGLQSYFTSSVWLPSICAAALHASVLAWSGTLVTWLLNYGFSLTEVTAARALGSIFEIGSTVIFPWAVDFFMKRRTSAGSTSYRMIDTNGTQDVDDAEDELGESPRSTSDKMDGDASANGPGQLVGTRNLHFAVVKVANLAMLSLSISLIPVIISLAYLDFELAQYGHNVGKDTVSPLHAYPVSVVAFFACLSLSFLGRWTFDLAETQLAQMLIPVTYRSSFGGTEQAIVSCFGLIHWVAAAIWHRQEDFVWLSVGSFSGIAVATLAYAWWQRQF
jgi:solute carrier family 40 (iron-regulated transporter), member 1